VCCNNVAKVQKISETTKHFANYFIKNFKKLRKPSPESGTRFSEGVETPTKFGARNSDHGRVPTKSRATNPDHGNSTCQI
jgi:hypothetical protein